jgi:uncharacterized membrane protein YfcA
VALLSTLVAGAGMIHEWQDIHLPSASVLVVSSLVGTPLGVVVLRYADEQLLKMILAGVIIGFSAFCLLGRQPFFLKTDRLAWAFGLGAGVLGGAFNINGPPLVIYGTLRNWSAERFRATLQGYFLPVSLFTFVAQVAGGLWSQAVLWYFVASLPVVALAFLVGRHLSRCLKPSSFVRAVHVLLLAIGTVLLVETWRG